MSKVTGLENWDFSGVPLAEQVAKVTVLVVYPEISEALLALAPKERKESIARTMRTAVDTVLATNKLSNWKLLRNGRLPSRYYGISGEIKLLDIQHIAALASVQSVRVESTNGQAKRPAKVRKKQCFYGVKMTVAIQIEGHEKGRQSYEERYLLFKGHSEAEVLQKAEAAALDYQHAYLNSDGLLVRWKLESLDGAYEVVLAANAKDLEGAEVFSVLKTRLLPKRDAPPLRA